MGSSPSDVGHRQPGARQNAPSLSSDARPIYLRLLRQSRHCRAAISGRPAAKSRLLELVDGRYDAYLEGRDVWIIRQQATAARCIQVSNGRWPSDPGQRFSSVPMNVKNLASVDRSTPDIAGVRNWSSRPSTIMHARGSQRKTTRGAWRVALDPSMVRTAEDSG